MVTTSDFDDGAVARLTEQYDVEARAYAAHWAPIVHPVACRLLDELPQHTVERALDLGAGAGLLLPVIRDKFKQALVVGIDRSEGLLGLAGPDAPLVVGDAAGLCLRKSTFDLVVMAFMLYHIPNPMAALSEAVRILTPRGMLALTTWAGDMESPMVRIWNEELDASRAVAPEALGRIAQHDLMDTPDKIENLLKSAGFVSVCADIREFTHDIELDEFIRLRTRVGSTRQRFESLNDIARNRLLERVRERMSTISDHDVALRLSIIFASARLPG
ncbi:MAG: class I SAM-dependent methyltransferase [Candidatus Latescibacterota bacterium]|nr:MAG: class I SAM-dependent methyltransferase [Candidatus Latescibacterota bacterium]